MRILRNWICLRCVHGFLPPNQEKVAKLFFLEHAVFILQMAQRNSPETSVTNTNLRRVTSEKIESLNPAQLARPGSTFGKSQAVLEQRNTERSFQ